MTDSTTIFGDNQGSIALTKNPEHQSRTKHIDTQYHFVPEQVKAGNVINTYINTEDMLADLFTKVLDNSRHHRLCHEIGLSDKIAFPSDAVECSRLEEEMNIHTQKQYDSGVMILIAFHEQEFHTVYESHRDYYDSLIT